MRLLILLIILGAIVILLGLRKRTVREFQAGMWYRNGRFRDVLEPGGYFICPFWSEIKILDLRKIVVTVPGQELLSKDNIGLKVTVALAYRIVDPVRASHAAADYQSAIYVAVQLALRDAIASRTMDEVLEKRSELGQMMRQMIKGEADSLGLEVDSAEFKDVMFPGELKKIYSELVRARKEGEALLERARGETAALRNLANAARMLDNNPNLFNLRLLQAVTAVGTTPGNATVFKTPLDFIRTGVLSTGPSNTPPPLDDSDGSEH